MRDSTLFTQEKIWTAEESLIADKIIASIHANPTTLPDDDFLAFLVEATDIDREFLQQVWNKLQTFPHMFEIYNARGILHKYDLHGSPLPTKDLPPREIPRLYHYNFYIDVTEIQEFLRSGDVSKGLFMFFMSRYRQTLPSSYYIHKLQDTTKLQELPLTPAGDTSHIFFLRSASYTWAMFLLSFTTLQDVIYPSLDIWTPEETSTKAWDSTIQCFLRKFRLSTHAQHSYQANHAYTYTCAFRSRVMVGVIF